MIPGTSLTPLSSTLALLAAMKNRRRRPFGMNQAANEAMGMTPPPPFPPFASVEPAGLAPGGQAAGAAGALGGMPYPQRDLLGPAAQEPYQTLPGLPSLADAPRRDAAHETRDTLKGLGIANALSLLFKGRLAPAGGQLALLKGARGGYDAADEQDRQEWQDTSGLSLRRYGLEQGQVEGENSLIGLRNRAAQDARSGENAVIEDANQGARQGWQDQETALDRRRNDTLAADKLKQQAAAGRLRLLMGLAKEGENLTPEAEAALSQAIADAGGVENLPADLFQMGAYKTGLLANAARRIGATVYGIDKRAATQKSEGALGRSAAQTRAETITGGAMNRAVYGANAAMNRTVYGANAAMDRTVYGQGQQNYRATLPGKTGGASSAAALKELASRRLQIRTDRDKLQGEAYTLGQEVEQMRRALSVDPSRLSSDAQELAKLDKEEAAAELPAAEARLREIRGKINTYGAEGAAFQRESETLKKAGGVSVSEVSGRAWEGIPFRYPQDRARTSPILGAEVSSVARELGVTPIVTTARTGHRTYVAGTNRVSRHMNGTGVDIAAFKLPDGRTVSYGSNRELFTQVGNAFAKRLAGQGYARNVEQGNDRAVLWQTHTGGNHFNHLHVSNRAAAPSWASQPRDPATQQFVAKKGRTPATRAVGGTARQTSSLPKTIRLDGNDYEVEVVA